MKNFLFALILTAAAAAVMQIFLPWWIIALAAFVVAVFIKQNAQCSFLAGFAAIFLLWSFYALSLSAANGNLLAAKVAEILPLQGRVWVLILLTGFLGALVSGFAALSGYFFRTMR